MSEAANRPGRLGVGVIGAGRVGAVLGAALRAAGHGVVGVAAVSEASRERAELLLPEVPILTPQQIVERAELVLLAVPDDQLADLVSGLAATGHWQAGQLVAHTAGRWGVEVLEPARQAGAIGLAIHPSMTFTGLSLDLPRLSGCAFGVTAPAAVLPIAQALVMEMGGEPVVIAEADRPIYHAALAHGANHLTTITGQALQLLGELGLEQPERVLGPLARAALDNALSVGESALTGPVARGDAGTVAEHRQTLAEHALGTGQQDIDRAYRALAALTADRARDRGMLTEAQHAQVLEALDLSRSEGSGSAHAAVGQGAAALGGFPAADASAPRGSAESSDPVVVREPEKLRAAVRREVARRGAQLSIGFVPTMGALHEGHAHLVRRAREENDLVIVSIFVNPLQFGPNEDFERYPSDLEADLELLGGLGVDLVFAPGLEDMYPGGDPLVTVSSGRLGTVLDGASRPGHFDGVVTVVNKLLSLVSGRTEQPLRAYFGQKDAQQLLIVQRMVRDTNLDVEIRPVPIVRAPDGLALSSRNAYLDDDERRAGLVLSRTLGELALGEIDLPEARRRIDEEPIGTGRTVELDYLVVVEPETLSEIPPRPGALALVAARVGTTRLIDNREIEAAPRP